MTKIVCMIGHIERIRIKRWLANVLTNRKDDITTPDGSPSLVKLIEMVKAELGFSITRQTMATYLKEDLTKYLDETTGEYSNEMREYDTMMASAKEIWDNLSYKAIERTKAYNSWLKAKKQREDLERKLQAERIREAEVRKPNYLVKFEPGQAKRICPECGHEFYDNVKKVKSDVTKTEE